MDCEALKSATYKFFGPESPYEDAENARYTVGKEDKVSECQQPQCSTWNDLSLPL